MKANQSIDKILERYDELSSLLSDPTVMADNKRFRQLAKEQSELVPIVDKAAEADNLRKKIDEDEEILKGEDEELKTLAEEEIRELNESLRPLEEEMRELLLPKDPDDSKRAVLEIRAGTGGDEAAMFAADLFRMYTKYFERKGLKYEVLSSSPTNIGGFKEVILSVAADNSYGDLKFESGVHRVQRVPVTETSGRIHTSAASVAVLPEADEVDVEINMNDLKIDVYRSTGPGGQSVNTTDSAVRITHLPTGLVVSCQDEKSQHKNKAKALKVLRTRLLEQMKEEQQSEIAAERRLMVGTGDRSAKVRTYNYPQNRVTDHRINLTLYSLDEIVNGDLDELIEANKRELRAKLLQELEKEN
ncbi:MAG: peptide chain release factor 1 [Candidatus Marinimicrobia bacterium]|nr:peptide chain release factor 1 [Candidatus Neomarinimicrobiota bacterium]